MLVSGLAIHCGRWEKTSGRSWGRSALVRSVHVQSARGDNYVCRSDSQLILKSNIPICTYISAKSFLKVFSGQFVMCK